MEGVALVGVPFDGYGRPGHQAAAPEALRAAGLTSAFGSRRVIDHGDLRLPAPDPRRGETTSLINEEALLAMVGHEDTMPLDVSEDGEAANTEIGLLLGLTGRLLTGPLTERVGVIGKHEIVVLGPRDEEWRRRFNLGSLRDHGVWFRDWRQTLARPEEHARDAVRHLRATADRWWLHVDLDVLDPEEFAAQGVPGGTDEPDGLTWPTLTALLTTAVAQGGCLGWSVAIYDPELDPSRTNAGRIVHLVEEVTSALSWSSAR